MTLSAEVTAKSYVVEIPTKDFLLLTRRDIDDEIAFDESLEKLGASSVEYNGHFGANIFFNLDVEDEGKLPAILKAIEKEIKTLKGK